MLAIWHLRPATQRRFPLHKDRTRDWLRYLAWCATDGRKDYAILREIPEWDEELSRPVNLPHLQSDRWKDAHSLGTFLHGVTVHRWSLSGMLRSAWARDLATRGFWRGARHRNHIPPPPVWQKRALQESFGDARRLGRFVSQRRHHILTDQELVDIYRLHDLDETTAQPPSDEAAAIVIDGGLQRSPIPLPQPLMRLLEPVVQLTRQRPSHAESVQVMSLVDTKPRQPHIAQGTFGVNLIGFARGELGIGEDIRQVALTLEAQGIPMCILDFAPGKNISQSDDTAERLMSDEPLYGINIFCLTGVETTRYVCERGLSTVEGRYNIGLWPWELPDWPENCRHAYACVDEIWGISEFTANAHRFAAPRPVVPMGLPVALGPVGKQTRRDFGLPEKAFLFNFAFDVSSSAERKNPEGLIRAFRQAFPKEDAAEVGLVLKVSHAETKSKLWKQIRRQAQKDERIHLIERTMRRPELLALMKACDCYVSLHRGEGFGRCLAEALLLDKQLIATGFSGNMDFCREPRVALVRHTMRAVRAGEYMWSEGQSWAEPDISHAAELMRSIRHTPRDTSDRDFDFSPASVGARYAERLRALWSEHSPAASTIAPSVK
jgi:glycosyltransferase involved in cell wall biosynthesis